MVKSGSVLAMGVAFVLAVSECLRPRWRRRWCWRCGRSGSWLAIRRRYKRWRHWPRLCSRALPARKRLREIEERGLNNGC